MKEAIQKAIEGGYRTYLKDNPVGLQTHGYVQHYGGVPVNTIFLDPLFWQALGKSLGWVKGEEYTGENYESSHEGQWKTEWHRFIDHLAEGKDPEEFFKDLLSTNSNR